MKRILFSLFMALAVSATPVMGQSFWDILGSALNDAVKETNRQLTNQLQQQQNAAKARQSSTQRYSSDISGIHEVTCYMCGGSGVCGACGGTAYISYTSSVSGLQRSIPCPTCAQSRTCSTCHGTGTTLIDDGTLDGRSSGSDNSNSNSTYNSSSSYGGSSSSCVKCHGKGVCPTCDGKGIYFSTTYAVNQWITCPSCSGSKVCSLCGGR